jgi:ABC-type uncharacterized transport system substrate-binding protein
MKRRKFVGLLIGAPLGGSSVALGGISSAWPLAALAQQPEGMRRIGVLTSLVASEQVQSRIDAFLQELQQLGWTVGRNLRIDQRSAGGSAEDLRKFAAEITALSPDVILAVTSPVVAELRKATGSVPIVFVQVVDPIGAGFVDSLARPGGNATGFMLSEYALGGKWLELLKQVAPSTTRVAVIRDPAIAAGTGQFGAIQAVAPSFGVELTAINVQDAAEIERGIGAFARDLNDGLIVTASPLAVAHRKLIVDLAVRYRLPAVYFARFFVADSGLMSYGVDVTDQYRGAASYVDRILRGEKPGNLPVQAPAKFELVIKPENCQGAWLRYPALAARTRRRGNRMKRRAFIGMVTGAAVLAPVSGFAQETGRRQSGTAKVPGIGVLSNSAGEHDLNPLIAGVFTQLQRLGWVNGQSAIYEPRFAAGDPDLWPVFVTDLVDRKVNVIVATGHAAARVAQIATATIPIVALAAEDMEEAGLVASIARPGSNITGVSIFGSELDEKRLELLSEMVPAARRMAALAESNTKPSLAQVAAIAHRRGIKLVLIEAPSLDKLNSALDAVATARVDAVNVLASSILYNGRRAIIDRMAASRLPAIYEWPEFAAEGALMGYGPTQALISRLVAEQIDRALKGVPPAELPVLRPTKFELAINVKTAKALGLTAPPSLRTPRRRGDRMKRREFITLLGGAAASSACWPFAARAQQQAAGRLPLVAVLVAVSQAASSGW